MKKNKAEQIKSELTKNMEEGTGISKESSMELIELLDSMYPEANTKFNKALNYRVTRFGDHE